MKPEIIYQTPSWYFLLCLAAGLLYALLLYYKESGIKKKQKLILGIIRGVTVFFLAFFLLNPLIKTIKTIVLKPKVLMVLDNSKSISFVGKQKINQLLDGIKALKKEIEENGYEVEIKDLNYSEIAEENINQNFTFNNTQTNLSGVFAEIKTNFEGQNLSDVILISDGIINEGVSPTFQKFNFNVHTVGVGDTSLKKDVFIAGIAANKLAYLGNKFTVNVDVASYLLVNNNSTVLLKNDEGKVLAKQVFNISSNDFFKTVQFELNADKVGKQRYEIEILPVSGEFSTKNNKKEIVIDIVNGREKILLLGFAPHPDIKAIKAILDKNDLFDTQVQILQSTPLNTIGKDPFDILILHQLPDVYGSSTGLVSGLIGKQKPVFFIVGSKTNVAIFNGMQNVLGINSQLNKLDKVTTNLNSGFKLFNLGENSLELFKKLPPLSVPFGEYKLFPGTDVLLFQQVSGITTDRPLFAINRNGERKSAVLVGEGLWQWRMEEFGITENQYSIDELITKTLQLISVKDDKSKLRVYPLLESFGVDDPVIFETEIYNSIYEKIYDQNVNLKLKSKNGLEKEYNFLVNKESSKFRISNLPAGLYTYTASTTVEGKNEVALGQLLVTQNEQETSNAVANFGLLKTLSNENNGDFVEANNIIELRKSLESKGLIEKLISNEELKDFINLRWILFLLIFLLSIEWALRKYFGSY